MTYYARVSTEKDEQLHSLTAQVSYYNKFIRDHPNWQLVKGYIDEGISGTSVRKRESFLRMIDDAAQHQFDFVVTKEISRFSRNTLDSIRYTQELLKYGVGVLFQSDNINTLMPDSELRLTIMSSVAQEEVRKTSERVRFGFRRAVERGVVLGSNRIWGYRKENGRLMIDEREAEMVRLIFDLYANEQMGIRGIAARLTETGYRNSNGNPFSFSTIRGILVNPKYKGYYCGGKSTKIDYKLNTIKSFDPEQWVMYEDHENVPPIVTEELWEKANHILLERSNKQSARDKSSYQNKYPYSGKILCGIHREPFYRSVYRYKSGDKEVWQCQEYVKNGKNGCNAPALYTYEINSIMMEVISEALGQREKIGLELMDLYQKIDSVGKLKGTIDNYQGEMENLMRRKDRLLDLSIDGKISEEEFQLRNERFNDEYLALQQKLSELLKEQQKNQALLRSVETLRGAINQELNFREGLTIGVADALLDHLEVYGTGDRNIIEICVCLKVFPEQRRYRIERRRGKPSVCSRQYI